MKYTFRNKLLENNVFKEIWKNEQAQGNIIEIPDEIWKIIRLDQTEKKIGENETKTFEEILKEGYNEGRCYTCTTELALLLTILGYNVHQVNGYNRFFRNTIGSKTGSHYWLELEMNSDWYVIDTSLLCMIKKYHTYNLGYEPEKSMSGKTLAESFYHKDYYREIKEEVKRNKK